MPGRQTQPGRRGRRKRWGHRRSRWSSSVPSFMRRRDSSRSPSTVITSAWSCFSPMSRPAPISGTNFSAGASPHRSRRRARRRVSPSDRVANPHGRSSRREARGGPVAPSHTDRARQRAIPRASALRRSSAWAVRTRSKRPQTRPPTPAARIVHGAAAETGQQVTCLVTASGPGSFLHAAMGPSAGCWIRPRRAPRNWHTGAGRAPPNPVTLPPASRRTVGERQARCPGP